MRLCKDVFPVHEKMVKWNKPFNPNNLNSHLLFLYISYSSGVEKLFKTQFINFFSHVVMSLILMTTLF